MATDGNNLGFKCPQYNYHCDICDYNSIYKRDYERHIKTKKHVGNKMATDGNKKSPNAQTSGIYKCDICEKIYLDRSGLWKHKTKGYCHNLIKPESNENENEKKELINADNKSDIYEIVKYLIKENSELKTMMLEQQNNMMEQQNKMMEQQNLVLEIAKNGTHNTTHTNSHNKTFNLQFFLNETCKDAMNIMDFVEQIVLNLNDLEETGRLGFAEGISKMILQRLKKLDITQRPIHCSDLKRETLYIKDENKWEKEEETKPKLTKAVKEIAGKNIKQIKDWQKKYPDYNDPESKRSDKYMNMVMNVMAGGTIEEIQENYEKIVKNITKEAVIDKEKFMS
jgi:hypothetical protein